MIPESPSCPSCAGVWTSGEEGAFDGLMAPVMDLGVAQQGIIQDLHPAVVSQSYSVGVQRSFCHTTQHSLCSHFSVWSGNFT